MTAVVASGSVYVQTAASQLTAQATPAAAPSAFSTGLAGAITHLASDGVNWYATDGATVRRNNAAADPGANWSTEDVTEIAWCTDRIMGLDTVAAPNELIAFSQLGPLKATLDPKSFTIATFALCGFANLSSIGIQIGGIGALAPERRHDLARLGLRAMLAGTFANFLTATIAGMLL